MSVLAATSSAANQQLTRHTSQLLNAGVKQQDLDGSNTDIPKNSHLVVGDGDLVLGSSALILSRHVQDTVSVDIKDDANLGHTTGGGGNARQLKLAQQHTPGTGDGGGEVNTLKQGVQLDGGLGSAGQSALRALAGSAQAARGNKGTDCHGQQKSQGTIKKKHQLESATLRRMFWRQLCKHP
eukprot:1161083-Pelagomonas_calceolata.AAC.5